MGKITACSKVNASSLVEVLVAMVIIMAVFTAALGIYTKVTQSSLSLSKMKAQKQMAATMQNSILNMDWEDQAFSRDSIDYKKSVSAYAGYKDIVLMEVTASQNGAPLGKLRKLVKRNEKEN